jgi:hypothetical protein
LYIVSSSFVSYKSYEDDDDDDDDDVVIDGATVTELWPPVGLLFIPEVVYNVGEPCGVISTGVDY